MKIYFLLQKTLSSILYFFASGNIFFFCQFSLKAFQKRLIYNLFQPFPTDNFQMKKNLLFFILIPSSSFLHFYQKTINKVIVFQKILTHFSFFFDFLHLKNFYFSMISRKHQYENLMHFLIIVFSPSYKLFFENFLSMYFSFFHNFFEYLSPPPKKVTFHHFLYYILFFSVQPSH